MANKYMYLYLGGGAPPASEAEGKAMMAKWMEYFGKLGPAGLVAPDVWAGRSRGARTLRHSRSGFGGRGCSRGAFLPAYDGASKDRVTSQPRGVY